MSIPSIHPSAKIHPSAFIDDNAVIGAEVQIGPFAIIEAAEIGDHSQIDGHAVVKSNVTLGKHNHVHAQAVIGGQPQDLGFDPEQPTHLVAGDHNVFRENVTISRATQLDGATRIGNYNYFMANTHVAHDCVIGDYNIMANEASLAGHITLGDRIFVSGGVKVHQFARIGSYAMIAGMAPVNRDVIPFTLLGRNPAVHYRLNTVGLRRAGIKGDRYRALNQAFRLLRDKQSLDELPDTEEITYLRAWLAEESKRGHMGFLKAGQKVSEDD